MTIREFIINNEIKSFEERLSKLEEMSAPAIIIDSQRKAVDDLRNGVLKIGGAVEKLDNEMIGFEIKKGNGGKPYVEFADGTRYFPQAKYGRYIA